MMVMKTKKIVCVYDFKVEGIVTAMGETNLKKYH